jgi:hypothetical protein
LYDPNDTYEKALKRREKKYKDAMLLRMAKEDDSEEDTGEGEA